MNGINYSSLFTNNNGINNVNGSTKFKGKLTGSKNDKKSKTSNEDTVEINGQSRSIPKAGYDKPKAVVRETANEFKKINEDGIQEGIELSDAAKEVLKELREKYKNMDIKVMNWSSDEEQDYYASRTDKDYSVLIAPEALEAMAADASEKEKYMSILDSAGTASEQIKEQLGDDVDKIKNFTITIDKDGKVSYMVQLIKDFAERNANNAKSVKERLEESKEAEKEKLKEKKNVEKLTADSIDELIAKIKDSLKPAQTDEDKDKEVTE